MTLLLVAGVGQAMAATLTVTTFDDSSGAGDGLCSLREAIAAVDSPGTAGTDCKPAAFGANTIVIPSGTSTLSSYFDPITQTGGEFVIAPTVTSLTIVGAGEKKTKIAASRSLFDRLFRISAGATVTIKDLTLTGGRAVVGNGGTGGNGGPAGDGANGGAILNAGSLTLIGAAVTNSRAGDGGGGGFGAGAVPNGGPGGVGGAGGAGGAIYNTGTLALEGSTIAGNHAGTGGAGGSGGNATTQNGGTGGAGGTGGEGGGVANVGGTLTVRDSTFNGNASGDGGAGGGGGSAGPGADGGGGGSGGSASRGGGIVSTGGTVSITDSTFASNTAGDGGMGGSGGGAGAAGGDAASGGTGGSGGSIDLVGVDSSSLQSVTIAGNSAGAGGEGGLGGNGATLGANGAPGLAGTGGGIVGQGSATTIQNSLLASNSGGNCSASIIDSGHNLSFAGAGCPATFATADPSLGPLQDNGGPAQTISLGPGSAAIDVVASTGAGCPAADERGVQRPSGSGCDIGAYEVAPPAASTGRARSITASSAIVMASVTPNAGDAVVQFQFGRSAKYKSKTAVQHVGGVAAVTVTKKLTGLFPRTTYHYRVTVVAPDGTVKAQDRTFKTSKGPALTRLSVKPAGFRASGPGATITYFDSEAATTTFTVRRCTKPLAHGGCGRFVKVTRFTHRDHAGRNKLTLRGRIGSRTLGAGLYRLDAIARAAKKTGNTASANFRILA
ncbi:MAG: choice-of-anchor Q domain-containing protein [Solirubrobacteraceae bacterium]